MVEESRSFSLITTVRERADKLLSELLNVSRNRVQHNMMLENVSINGNILQKNSFKNFKRQDLIEIELEQLEQLSLEPEKIPLDIVFENKDFLIVNKPAGMVVHPAVGHPCGTLMNAVLFHCRHLEEDSIRPGLLHRIDKDTSGLLVIAKNRETFDELVKKFAAHNIERRYYALIWGHLKQPEGTIETLHGRDPRNRLRFTPHVKNGRRAVTHYRTIENFHSFSLVECRLETGRTHQIRMHMKELNHPIVNDELYNGVRKSDDSQLNSLLALHKRQMLHAATLGFTLKGEEFFFQQELPSDMKKIITYLSR